jgi:putative DNA primase/helicase
MALTWSDERRKFLKTPVDLRTGLTANSEEIGVPFVEAQQRLDLNLVLSYRHPSKTGRYLGLIDSDECIGPDGLISPLGVKMLRYMNTYAEYSVTNGIHILCWLDDVPPGGHKDRRWNVEFYWMPSPIPITGNRVVLPDWESPEDIQLRTQRYLTLHKDRFPDAWLPPAPPDSSAGSSHLTADEILFKLFREPDGNKWADIYSGNWQGYYQSPSEADLAVLMKLAFYTGKDRQMMESVFSESPLSKILIRGTVEAPTRWRKPKWADAKYRSRSIEAAIARTTKVYTPVQKPMSDQDFYKMRRQQINEKRQ